jgi:diaminopimelate decarboxylase
MKKTPFVTKEQIAEIVKTYPTPFHIYDEKGIRQTARNLNNAFSWNEGFKEYFAVKATPNPAILKILKEEGCGVDTASYAELLMAQKCGFKGDEIMFSSNQTPIRDFKFAKELGAIINFDDITHIDRFLEFVGDLPKTICCRYNPGGDFCVNGAVMGAPIDAKYGFTYNQLVEGFKKLKENGVEHFGIHAFLASNMIEKDYYPTLAGVLFNTVVNLYKDTGIKVDFINLSGGIGIPYEEKDEPCDIAYVGRELQKVYNDILVKNGITDVKLKTELGRYMLGPNGHLIATVIGKKDIYKKYIGLDACAANLMRPAIYGAYHHITVLGKEDAPKDHVYDVVGGLCENCDKFAIDRELPEMDYGDFVAIHDAGAHGFSMGYNYNGKLRSAELLLKEDGSVELIRRAETEQDYFATLDIYDEFKK